MNKPVEFQFGLGEKVLTPLDVMGVILQRCERGEGLHDYQVVWWAESKRYTEWLLPHELRHTQEKP